MDVAQGFLAGFTLAFVVMGYFVIIAMSKTVASMNVRLNMVLKHHGIDVYEGASREAQELVRQGKKIEAIKVYREATGVSLAEAKTAVERLPTT